MTTTDLLRDVLTEHAALRPDPDEVLAAVRGERSVRRGTATRTLAVAATAVAVAALAVTGVVLGRGPGGSADPVSHGVPAAASAPAAVPVSSPAALASCARTAGYATIAAGWLPGPVSDMRAGAQPGSEQRDYTVEVDGVQMDVIIWVLDGTGLPTRTEAGSNGTDLTINGHPARKFVDSVATIVAVDLGNGTVAYAGPSVVATTAQVTTARITDIAVHVATDMQFGRHDPIPPSQWGNHVIAVGSGAPSPATCLTTR